MVSVLTRATLAREAAALNAASRWARKNARLLPPLILMTDAKRLPDPLRAACALPKGSMVILRHTEANARIALGVALIRIARARGLHLLVADDPMLASAIGATGLHCSEKNIALASHWRTRRKDWLITISAHSGAGLRRAALASADAAILAPVFATQSHPGAVSLGPLRFHALSRAANLPVYALGGIDGSSVKRLRGSKAVGIAAIGALIAD